MSRSDAVALIQKTRRFSMSCLDNWKFDAPQICYANGIRAEKMVYCIFLFSYFFGDRLSWHRMYIISQCCGVEFFTQFLELNFFYYFNFALNCHYQVVQTFLRFRMQSAHILRIRFHWSFASAWYVMGFRHFQKLMILSRFSLKALPPII
jgi:hypothetical protein